MVLVAHHFVCLGHHSDEPHARHSAAPNSSVALVVLPQILLVGGGDLLQFGQKTAAVEFKLPRNIVYVVLVGTVQFVSSCSPSTVSHADGLLVCGVEVIIRSIFASGPLAVDEGVVHHLVHFGHSHLLVGRICSGNHYLSAARVTSDLVDNSRLVA